MSAPRYQIIWRTPAGDQIGFMDSFTRLEMAYSEREVGAVDLVFPAKFFRMGDIQADQILEIYRAAEGGPLVLEGERAWFIRDWMFDRDYVSIRAFDGNYLLDGRLVAYAAGTAQAKKAGKADNIMKAVIRENMGSLATDTTRNLSGLSVEADHSLGPEIKKEYSRDGIMTLLQGLHALALENGTYITFDTVRSGAGTFEFRTYKDRRGANLGRSGNTFVFSEDNKNLTEIRYEESHADEKTFAYAGGKGEGTARAIATASSSGMLASKWNRREVFKDGRATSDLVALASEAKEMLYERRPRRFISGTVIQAPGSRYGIDYGYGSEVAVNAFGYVIDCRLSTIHITMSEQSAETVDIKLRGEVTV